MHCARGRAACGRKEPFKPRAPLCHVAAHIPELNYPSAQPKADFNCSAAQTPTECRAHIVVLLFHTLKPGLSIGEVRIGIACHSEVGKVRGMTLTRPLGSSGAD